MSKAVQTRQVIKCMGASVIMMIMCGSSIPPWVLIHLDALLIVCEGHGSQCKDNDASQLHAMHFVWDANTSVRMQEDRLVILNTLFLSPIRSFGQFGRKIRFLSERKFQDTCHMNRMPVL